MQTETPIDLIALLYALRSRLWIVLATLALFLALAAIYLLHCPRIYTSSAAILIESQDRRVASIQDVAPNDLKSYETLKTVEQTLLTDTLLSRVIQKNHLGTNSNFVGPGDADLSQEGLLKKLAGAVHVKVRRGTRLIDIAVDSSSPELARQLTQSMVDEFLQSQVEGRAGVSTAANKALFGEVNAMKIKLEGSERALQDYREKNNTVSLEEKQNIVVETLKDLNSKLTEAQAQRMKLQSDVASIDQAGATDAMHLLAISSLAETERVRDAKHAVTDKEADVAKLRERYRAENPKLIQGQSELTQSKTVLIKTLKEAALGSKASLDAALKTERALEEALAQQQKSALELNRIAIPFNSIAREADSSRALYQVLLTRLKETAITTQIDQNPVRQVETPRVPQTPSKPKTFLIVFCAICGGLGFGAVAALAVYAMDSTVRHVDEAEELFKIPVIAAVPYLRRKAKLHPQIPMVSKPHSSTSEAFRSMRTSLELKEKFDRQIILFTSAVPNEGKTMCSINCAVALTQQGYKTLIIDADLRRPSIAKALECDAGEDGLSDVLQGTGLEPSIRKAFVPGLSILTAGRLVHSPAELLSHHKLVNFFKDPVLEKFDRIIIDTSPVTAVSDALHLVKYATAVCLVICANRTPVRILRKACRSVLNAKPQDLSLVLNRIANDRSHHRHGYGHKGIYGAGEPARA
jgi:polysaccharide biosynthesis transport protein